MSNNINVSSKNNLIVDYALWANDPEYYREENNFNVLLQNFDANLNEMGKEECITEATKYARKSIKEAFYQTTREEEFLKGASFFVQKILKVYQSELAEVELNESLLFKNIVKDLLRDNDGPKFHEGNSETFINFCCKIIRK